MTRLLRGSTVGSIILCQDNDMLETLVVKPFARNELPSLAIAGQFNALQKESIAPIPTPSGEHGEAP